MLDIKLFYNRTYSLLMYDSKIPLISRLDLANVGREGIFAVKAVISVPSLCISEYVIDISGIAPDEIISLTNIDLELKRDYLKNLKLSFYNDVLVKIYSGDKLLAEKNFALKIFCERDWLGLDTLPELVPMYIDSNSASVAEIMRDAAQELRLWEGYGEFRGYCGTTRAEVISQISAIYKAIYKRNINCEILNYSMRDNFGRVRNFEEVLGQNKANLLELSFFLSACLESAGLRPILVFYENYVLVACWLNDDGFGEWISGELGRVLIRAEKDVGEIRIIDTMCLFADDTVLDFEDAVLSAEKIILSRKDFNCLIDIGDAREVLQGKNFVCNNIGIEEGWKNMLKRLSMMNPLINFVPQTDDNIQLIFESVEIFQEVFQDGVFVIEECPEDFSDCLSSDGFYKTSLLSKNLENIIDSRAMHGQLYSFADKKTTYVRLQNMLNAANLEFNESGVNILYVAVGMLRWFESNLSTEPRFSPIMLMPIAVEYDAESDCYSVSMRDNEVIVNIALVEFLFEKYGIDISDIYNYTDARGIFSTIRTAIKSKQNWTIDEYIVLSKFNFNELILWRDFQKRRDTILQNPVVSSILGKRRVSYLRGPMPVPADMEKSFIIGDMVMPLPLDSTQRPAAFAAATGESFVIYGAPGTGKSQTIASAIAGAMYLGKTVLFVSEKVQALAEVKKRLSEVGLGAFCLSMYSEYTKKFEFMEQISNVATMQPQESSKELTKLTKELFEIRLKFSEAMSELTKPRKCGVSVYDAILMYEENSSAPEVYVFDKETLDDASEDMYVYWESVLMELEELIKDKSSQDLAHIAEMSLVGISEDEALECRKNIEKVRRSCKFFANTLHFVPVASYRQINGAIEICKIISTASVINNELLYKENLFKYTDIIDKALNAVKRKSDIYMYLTSNFSIQIFNVNSSAAKVELSNLSLEEVPRHRIARFIRNLAKDPTSIDAQAVIDIISKIDEYQSDSSALENFKAYMDELFPDDWNDGNCDWSMIRYRFDTAVKIQSCVSLICKDPKQCSKIMANVAFVLKGSDYRIKKIYGDFAENLTIDVKKLMLIEEKIANKLGIKVEENRNAFNWLNTVEDILENSNGALPESVRENRYAQLRIQNAKTPLIHIFEALETGKIGKDTLYSTYLRALSRGFIDMFIEQSSVLQEFDNLGIENILVNLGSMAARYRNIAAEEIYVRLTKNLRYMSRAVLAEMNFLQRVLVSSGSELGIKEILDGMPSLIHTMFPCFMTTPAGVAQYIDEAAQRFDIVIFDEASKTATARAIGAISRGDSLVVVGDDMQLPPSEASSVVAFNDKLTNRDMKISLLDDCVNIGMYEHRLKIHYRSRGERLISFSNNMYYDGQLYTFPKPVRNDTAIELIRLDGVFDCAGTMQNRVEARAVVDEVVKRLSDDELREYSIMVVAFNAAQKRLIEQLLENEFEKNSALRVLAYDTVEPLLVRCIDSAQGYERDVAILSLCFGKDSNGVFSLNMGSLTRKYGYKRINIAISRAREKLIVFSSFDAESIELGRTTMKSVSDLQKFLKYVESYILPKPESLILPPRTGFEEMIAKKLREKGYMVETMVGASGLKVDIAVINPINPSEYLVAVLCDGIYLHDDLDCYDRYILQEDILVANGWNVVRVWPLEWVKNQEKEMDRIEAQIKQYM